MEINLKRLIKDLHNTDEDVRALSAMTLMKVDVADSETRELLIENLIEALKDKNISVRFFSRKAIDKQKKHLENQEGTAVSPSIDEALSSEDFEERLDGVMRVAKENKKEYKNKLVEMLKTEQHDFVKATLLSSLKLFLVKNEAFLLSPFLKDSDSRVRSNTIEALEALKADEAIPNLFPCLEDPDNRIRAVAAKALQSFGEGKVFAVLKKMLSSNEEWMKISSIYALSHIKAGEAIQMLLEAAKGQANVETRIKSIGALANYHDSTVHSFLSELLTHGEEPFKTAANRALKLMEEKYGPNPPSTTLVTSQKKVEEEKPRHSVEKPQESGTDITGAVTQFFRKGQEQTIGLSQRAAINFAITDLEKERDELQKEAGRVLFEVYQRGDLKIPELLTLGHEILRMNYFIQKYSEEEEKNSPAGDGGFFSQLKSFFSKASSKDSSGRKSDKFIKQRDTIFQKLGALGFLKFKSQEFTPIEMEGLFRSFLNIEGKIQKEKNQFKK